MKTLGLTSPHLHGHKVAELQRHLKRNWTGQDFLQGSVDGEFGSETARACVRAKYWLGYPSSEQKPIAGAMLLRLLNQKGLLAKEFETRRAQRLKVAKRKPLRVKALERAERDLGMKEHPAGSNDVPITRVWGLRGPWCAMAVSEWYLEAGSKAFKLHRDFAYVPTMLSTAEQGAHGLAIVRAQVAMPGDIVCFDWDDDGVADHTGLLRSKVEGDSFHTIEGNTAIGNDSNGGEVMHRDRSLPDVATFNRAPAFIRVGR